MRKNQVGFTVDTRDFETALTQAFMRAGGGGLVALTTTVEQIEEVTLALVPRDTETLASSWGYVIEKGPDFFRARMGYGILNDPLHPKTGQPASSYARRVHEDLSIIHATGRSKFLELPMNEAQETFLQNIATNVKGALG